MEHSHWTALQTVYPPDQIKTINWASLNKHIHNSLDLLRQSANSLNELTHTSSSSQNLPLWTCLLRDLSYLELKTPTGCGSDKERDGAAVVVPQQLLWEETPTLLWVMVWPATSRTPGVTVMAQGFIPHTLRQAQAACGAFALKFSATYLLSLPTYKKENKNGSKSMKSSEQ